MKKKQKAVASSSYAETFKEQLDRVRQMANGSPKWDLSDNDRAALLAVYESHDRRSNGIEIAVELLEACRTALDLLRHMGSDTFAIGGDRVIRERLEEAIERATFDLQKVKA